MPAQPSPSPSRRRLLATAGTAVIGSLAGCRSVLAPSQQQWSYEFDGEPYREPTVTDDAVYITAREDETGAVHAVSPDGTRRWRTEVPLPITTPVVRDGLVAVGTRAGLVALAAADGSERWRAPDDGKSTVREVELTDGVVAAATAEGAVTLIEPSGTERWRRDVEVRGPVAAGREAVVATVDAPDDPSREYALRGLDPATGERMWEQPTTVERAPRLRMQGDRLFVTGDRVAVREPGTGRELWTFDAGRAEDPSTLPVAVPSQGAVYVGTGVGFASREYGTVFRLFDGSGFPDFEFRTDATVASLAATDEAVFALVGGTLNAVGPDEMSGRWTADIGRAGLAARGRTCYAAIRGGKLVALAAD